MATIALIAHDEKKPALAAWAERHQAILRRHALICTGTTGKTIQDRVPDLPVRLVKSGPLGGDQQIGGMIAEGRIDVLIFFADPLTPMPHDVDVKALLRIALVYDIACAFNARSAELLMQSGVFGDPAASGD